jgi:hypothetical protein
LAEAKTQEDSRAARDAGARHVDVGLGHPEEALYGGFVAQEFLDRRWEQAGLGGQPPPRIRLAQQRQGARADEAGRRLVSRDEEQHARREDLTRAQAVPPSASAASSLLIRSSWGCALRSAQSAVK